ncbi:MAG: hypothetical protein ACM3NZ_09855 [Betaproteobacteria bacterium]|jgi:hypothetical protein
MIRRLAAVALYSSWIVAAVSWAQTPTQAESAPAPATAPSAAGRAALPMLRQDARAHDDADARECLEFLTNIGVIRCAEKYRNGARRPAH